MHVSPHFTRCHLGGVRWVINELVHLEGGETRVQQVDWQIILPSEQACLKGSNAQQVLPT